MKRELSLEDRKLLRDQMRQVRHLIQDPSLGVLEGLNRLRRQMRADRDLIRRLTYLEAVRRSIDRMPPKEWEPIHLAPCRRAV